MEIRMYKVTSIQKCMLNGTNVKLVEVYEKIDDRTNLFYGKFAVPARIANKRILEYLEKNNEI